MYEIRVDCLTSSKARQLARYATPGWWSGASRSVTSALALATLPAAVTVRMVLYALSSHYAELSRFAIPTLWDHLGAFKASRWSFICTDLFPSFPNVRPPAHPTLLRAHPDGSRSSTSRRGTSGSTSNPQTSRVNCRSSFIGALALDTARLRPDRGVGVTYNP